MTDHHANEPGIPTRCPHCSAAIDLADLLAIAEGTRLPEDPVLGGGEPLRFRPARFDVAGRPIDPSGAVCGRLACPRCRGEIAIPAKASPR